MAGSSGSADASENPDSIPLSQNEGDNQPLIKKQKLADYEKDHGFELKFVTMDEAIQTNLHFNSGNSAKLDMIARETLVMEKLSSQEGHTYIAHVYDGYHFLKNLGYDQLAKICLTHSFNLHTMEDYIGKIDISPEQYDELKTLLAATEYDDYDRLIQLLDSTCDADGTQNLEARMNDVKERYGYYPEGKWNKNFELKEYFEKLMGRDFYDVIK